MPVLGKRPNVFAAPVAKAYRPTMRDQVANLFSRALGDNYQSNELARGLFGSSGLGGGQGNLLGGLGLLDLTPIGAAFALEEAGRQIGGGQPVTGAANAALAVVPVPAVAKGGKAVVRRAARRVAGSKAARELKPYVRSYSGGVGTYDPSFFRVEPDQLMDDAGTVVGTRERLVPIRPINDQIPAESSPDQIFRGMSAAEFENFRQTGLIQSNGSGNIGDAQKGLTYWSSNPREATSYAGSFAPSALKPTPERPAYVVAARRPSPADIRDVPGVGDREVGVARPISRDEVVAAYRGEVVDYRPPDKFMPGGDFRLHWEQIQDIMKRYGVAAPVAAAILAGTMQPPKGKEPGA
jgi:hypothetical protein